MSGQWWVISVKISYKNVHMKLLTPPPFVFNIRQRTGVADREHQQKYLIDLSATTQKILFSYVCLWISK